MQTEQTKYLSPQEYLEIERQAEYKSEYYKGEMFALAGASIEHNIIAGNINSSLNIQFRQRTCISFQSDMKVLISEANLFTYPDVLVVCGEPKLFNDKRDIILNPIVIFEVLSSSTQKYDHGQKFIFYKKLESLKEYILVSLDEVLVEHYTKIASNEWKIKEYNSLNDKFDLPSIDCNLQLKDIYNKIEFKEN